MAKRNTKRNTPPTPGRGPGRPTGSTNAKQVDRAVATPTVCKKCGSTERTPYRRKPLRRSISGVRDGREYNQVVWRRTSCKNCDQVRDDVSFEFVGRSAARKR